MHGEARSANRARWVQGSSPSPVAVAEGGLDGPDTSDPAPIDVPTSFTANAAVTDVPVIMNTRALSPSDAVWHAAQTLQPHFLQVDRQIFRNARRVQEAMKAFRVGPHFFQGSTGYGHGDLGREALDNVFAKVFGAEAAMVRIQFMSGTHAIASALYAVLRPGDELLAVAGKPYDTMEEVVGLRQTVPGCGSLRDWGVKYRELPLTAEGRVDFEALKTAIRPETKCCLVQRSCGYSLRPTLSIDEIGRCVDIIKAQAPECIVVVDNCYGEFVEEREPTHVGADLCMGSLIKNGGGTIVPGGGYVAGREDLIERVAARLAAPGIGRDAGGVPGDTLRLMFQGLWLAPQMTGEALKGGLLISQVLSNEGFTVNPKPAWPRVDFITSVQLGSGDRMVAFCKAIQRRSPVGSYISPEPGVTAGYGDPVIFADGTFVDGATSELSADGPLREPYVVYCQGGNHWTHWASVLESAVQELRDVETQEQEAEDKAAKIAENKAKWEAKQKELEGKKLKAQAAAAAAIASEN